MTTLQSSRPDQPPQALGDPWFDWLTHRRQGGAKLGTSLSRDVQRYRDRVLDGAQLAAGETLLDVGTGDGLVALGAIARIGPSLHAILADISSALLTRAEDNARAAGVRDQCRFVEGPAERLPDIASASVDVVTTRSVLVYSAQKQAAAREFFRVLKPSGRVSIAEPVYRADALHLVALKSELQAAAEGADTRYARLFLRWKSAQLPSDLDEIERNPLTNFTEHDLVTAFEQAGFGDIHLEQHIVVRRLEPESWDKILDASPRPNCPTLREVLERHFSEDDRRYFEERTRPLAEAGQTTYRDCMTFLTARKPEESKRPT